MTESVTFKELEVALQCPGDQRCKEKLENTA